MAYFLFGTASAATRTVGPGKTFAAPCAAIAAATDGDLIEVDASGNYAGDVCYWNKNGLTIRGVNGRAHIDADGHDAGGKAIWVIGGNDTTIENIELSGCAVADKNGAGIRQEGTNLTVRHCYFHDNENGILTGANLSSEILIEYSEFGNNGDGEGYAHNMYIGNVGKFTLQYSYSHHAKEGHLVKSRAAENYILYNRITGEATGWQSYEIDLPNGGTSVVLGNVIEQSSSTHNPTMLTYREEGAAAGNPGTDLYVINNTFVNNRTSGGTFVNIQAANPTAAILTNNAFVGPGTVCSQATAVLSHNYVGTSPLFADAENYDYHPLSGSPLENTGIDPGTGAGMNLLPIFMYVHVANREGRVSVSTIDIGAFELNGSGPDDGGYPEHDGAVTSDSGGADTDTHTDSTSDGMPTGDTSHGDLVSPGDGAAQVSDESLATLSNPNAALVAGCACRDTPRAAWTAALMVLLLWMQRIMRRQGVSSISARAQNKIKAA